MLLLMAEKRSKLRKETFIISGRLTAETGTSCTRVQKLIKPAAKLVIDYGFVIVMRTMRRNNSRIPELKDTVGSWLLSAASAWKNSCYWLCIIAEVFCFHWDETIDMHTCGRGRSWVGHVFSVHNWKSRGFPGSPVVKTLLPMQGVRVLSLVGELRSHVLHGTVKKSEKEKKKIYTIYTSRRVSSGG